MPKYTKGPDGKYHAKVWDGTYKDGKKHYKYFKTDKSSRALEQIVKEYQDKVNAGTQAVKSDVVFLPYALNWVKVDKASVELYTRQKYETIINVSLLPLHFKKITTITRNDIVTIINSVTPSNARLCIIVLKQVLRAAKRDKIITPAAYNDLFEEVKVKKYTPKAVKRGFTNEEKEKIIKAEGLTEKEKAFVYLAYGCGMRRGEIMALKRSDFDFKAGQVNVGRSLGYAYNKVQIKPPKSEKGKRTIPIPSKLLPSIKKYVESVDDYLFISPAGTLYASTSFFASNIIRKLGLEGVTAHYFRHNYCSSLCYQIPKVSIKQIAKLLGDREEMVINVYSHIMEEQEDTMGAINNAF